jgi:hypothetical protein
MACRVLNEHFLGTVLGGGILFISSGLGVILVFHVSQCEVVGIK